MLAELVIEKESLKKTRAIDPQGLAIALGSRRVPFQLLVAPISLLVMKG